MPWVLADEISLKYAGERVGEDEFDATFVGGSMVAFGEYSRLLAREIHDEQVQVRTNIRTIQSGCCQLYFAILVETATNPLFGQLLPFVQYVKDSLALFWHLDGRPPASVSEIRNSPGSQLVQNQHGNVNVFYRPSVTFVQRQGAGASVEGFVRNPLSSWAENLHVISQDTDEPVYSVDRDASRIYSRLEASPDESQEEVESTREALLTIHMPALYETDRAWVFHDGAGQIRAKIEDEGFLERVRNRDREFRMGDRLKVRLKTRQIPMTDGSIKVEHTVIEVLGEPGER